MDNPIWRKPNYSAVWIYILLHANREERAIIWNNEKFTVEKGAYIGSIKQISDFYNLSTSTVSYILDYFISERMIEKTSTKKFSYFKVLNWDKYQAVESTSENKEKTSRNKQELKELKEEIETREETSLVTPSFEEYLENTGVTADYEDWGDDGVSNLVYRREGKKLTEKKLRQEYSLKYPVEAPNRPLNASRTNEKFNHDTWVISLKNSPKKVEKIIALVWTERGYHFDNYEQWRARMGQDIKYARRLEGYSASQIREVIDVCNKEEQELNYKWSMSTLAKKIANVFV